MMIGPIFLWFFQQCHTGPVVLPRISKQRHRLSNRPDSIVPDLLRGLPACAEPGGTKQIHEKRPVMMHCSHDADGRQGDDHLERSAEALKLFFKGYNCAQAVLYAFRHESNLPEEIALKIASGLGAGMGRKGEVCGAVTGGILVLGLRHGRGAGDGRAALDTTYAKTQELMGRFALKHGSCICRQLIDGCDLTTREGQRLFKKKGYLKHVCKDCVHSIVEILEQMALSG